METVEHAYFIYAMIYSFSSKHEFKLEFKHFDTSGDGHVFDNVNTLETFHAYQYRIYK